MVKYPPVYLSLRGQKISVTRPQAKSHRVARPQGQQAQIPTLVHFRHFSSLLANDHHYEPPTSSYQLRTKNAAHFFAFFLSFSQKRTYFSPFFSIFLYFSSFFSLFFLPVLPKPPNLTHQPSFLSQKPTSHLKINPKNRCF